MFYKLEEGLEKVSTVLLEDLSSVPSTEIELLRTTCNSAPVEDSAPLVSEGFCGHMHISPSAPQHIHLMKNKPLKKHLVIFN